MHQRLYPEMQVAGFSHVDGLVQFYAQVNALLSRDAVVLDYGAGRGRQADDPVRWRRELTTLRGRVAQVVGVDVDDAVRDNPLVDVAHVIARESPRIPLDDTSVDLIVSDWTFEHIHDPEASARELERVLKPGGWICARTPNRYGYIAVGARLVPNRLHATALRRLQPFKEERDTFPTRYRLNRRSAIHRHFPRERFAVHVYIADSEPAYAGGSYLTAWVTKTVQRFLPETLGSVMYVFAQKRQRPDAAG